MDSSDFRWYKYKLTKEQYCEMVKAQEHKCATCHRYTEKLEVDHDHRCCPGKKSCGKCTRKLLCSGCNSALGWVRDDILVLENLISYLKSYG
jgi:hypothetical protein